MFREKLFTTLLWSAVPIAGAMFADYAITILLLHAWQSYTPFITLSVAVIASGVAIALSTSETERLVQASLGAVISFGLFFTVNLMNPRWMAFGDVRLSLVFGFGLAWVSPIDLFEAFLYANVLALVAGVVLIASGRAGRKSALPFGLFMALGAALVLVT